MKFAAVLLAFGAFAHEFASCKDHKTDLLGVERVEFSPDPPKSGQDVSVTVSGHAQVELTGGKLKVDYRVFGVVVTSEEYNVCDIIACPLQPGDEYKGTVTQTVPAGTPSHLGATVRMTLKNQDDSTVSCLESYVQIGAMERVEGTLGETHHILKEEVEFMFNKWKAEHPNAVHNLEVFGENLLKIIKHNKDKSQSFTMAMNEFGSMTNEEFKNTRLGLREPNPDVERNGPLKPRVTLRSNVALADPPAQLDWTEKGVVAPVKNQGSCGSCWAFSAVGSLESAYAIKTGNLVELSEQELVSCDTGDYGCQGGLMDSAFDWIERSSSGLCTEADYGYTSGTTSARGECLQSSCQGMADTVPKGYIDIPPNEAALLAALNEHGPVSVAIEADQSAFQFYHSGVLTGVCGNHLDHGVLLVGYGVDEATGTPFWKVKNSWGAGWGEQGFVRILRGKRWPAGGECGIASKASYPIL